MQRHVRVNGGQDSYNTFRAHQRNDPDFAAQVREAEEEGAELLHDACWKATVEGEIEPVYWQGEVVGHVRKFDSRLRIEMLRAHLPDRFKTPGQAAVKISAPGAQVLVIGPEEQAELAANRRRYLESLRNKDQCPPIGGRAARRAGAARRAKAEGWVKPIAPPPRPGRPRRGGRGVTVPKRMVIALRPQFDRSFSAL